MSTLLLAERYRVDQLLGEVNHSRFHEGFDTRTQTRVLIRLIDLSQHENKFRAKLEGFMGNEFRVVADVVHPNALRTLDYGLEGTIYYQINDYIPFTTLQQYLLENRSLDLETVLRLVLEIADTVAYFHRINIIHCDLKPENILLDRNHIKLMEFSIANHVLVNGMITGTPPYMSPEAIYADPPAPARDIWALGITLFEMLAGRPPYYIEGRMNDPEAMPMIIEMVIKEPVLGIETLVPNLPPRLIALLNWMLEKDLSRRIGSMRQVAAEVEAILSGLQKPDQQVTVGGVLKERYRLQAVVAEGGFGQVFAGADLQTGSRVAVKKLKPELSQQAHMLARFKREAEILNRLDHPGIIKVLDTVEVGTDHYIVMPYMDGGDLRTLLNKGALPVTKALKLGLEIANGLARVHELDIIHRDIKPENVLLDATGLPHLTDFGVSYMQGATRLTQSNGLVGTFQYMAPEVLQGNSPSKESDIWAFGLLLYEMLTGNQPFLRMTVSQIILAILSEPIPDIQLSCGDCSEAVEQLMIRILERDPDKRMSSMQEVAATLQQMQP